MRPIRRSRCFANACTSTSAANAIARPWPGSKAAMGAEGAKHPGSVWSRGAGWLVALALAVLLSGCAGLPKEVERLPSHAITDTADTALGRLAVAGAPDAQQSGFRLLPLPA